MIAVVTLGAGFLLAVLWFDLMFDVQVAGHDDAELPEPVLASIAAYYARVTTAARPMNGLVPGAMAVVVVGLTGEVIEGTIDPGWLVASAMLGLPPMWLAATRVVPNAVRLATRRDSSADQSAIAREIHRDHRYCFASMAGLVLVQAMGYMG